MSEQMMDEQQEKEQTGLVEYLTNVKRTVESDGLDVFEKVHIVVGKEACDLDSTVSTLVYAFHLWKLNDCHRTSIVPILPIPQAEFAIKTEVKFVLAEHGIDETTLLFSGSHVDPVRLFNLDKLILTLVDHHVPAGIFTGCDGAVVEVIDHHPILETRQTRFLRNAKLTIEPVGSCATLIAEKLLANSTSRTFSPPIASLLYDTIALDTVNFSPIFHRATPKDRRIAEELTSFFTSRFTREEIFQRIADAKADVSGLTVDQILRKDVKMITGTLGKLALSSIAVLCQDYFDNAEKQQALREFCRENKLECVIVLGVALRDDLKKDILILTIDQDFLSEIVHELCASKNQDWSMELFRDYVFQPHDPLHCQHFRQGNTSVSRKQIIPILANLLGSNVQDDNSWRDTIQEEPDEHRVPALSPADFDIEADNITYIRRVSTRRDLSEDDSECSDLDECSLKVNRKRSPSPHHAQIDYLKVEHERMLENTEEEGRGRKHTAQPCFDRSVSPERFRKMGVDETDGNPASLLNNDQENYENGTDDNDVSENIPIISSASPVGFGTNMQASSVTSGPDLDFGVLLHDDEQVAKHLMDEDIVIDHTVASPIIWEPGTPSKEGAVTIEANEKDQLHSDDDKGSTLDNLDKPKKPSQEFSPRSALEDDCNPSAPPDILSVYGIDCVGNHDSDKDGHVSNGGRKYHKLGDTVDGLEPLSTTALPDIVQESKELNLGGSKSPDADEEKACGVVSPVCAAENKADEMIDTTLDCNRKDISSNNKENHSSPSSATPPNSDLIRSESPDWEMFEEIVNRHLETPPPFTGTQHNESNIPAKENIEPIALPEVVATNFTIAPELPRSELVDKQQQRSTAEKEAGIDLLDGGPVNENSNKENIPERAASPKPDTAARLDDDDDRRDLDDDRRDHVEFSSPPEMTSRRETASVFMLTEEEEVAKRSTANLNDSRLELMLRSPDEDDSDAGGGYPWTVTADIHRDSLDSKSDSEYEDMAEYSEANSKTVEENKVDVSQKSPVIPYPLRFDIDIPSNLYLKKNDQPGNEDTVDGLLPEDKLESPIDPSDVMEVKKLEAYSDRNIDNIKPVEIGPTIHIPPEFKEVPECLNVNKVSEEILFNNNVPIWQVENDASVASSEVISEENKGALVWASGTPPKFSIVTCSPGDLHGLDLNTNSSINRQSLSKSKSSHLCNSALLQPILPPVQTDSNTSSTSTGHDETDTGEPSNSIGTPVNVSTSEVKSADQKEAINVSEINTKENDVLMVDESEPFHIDQGTNSSSFTSDKEQNSQVLNDTDHEKEPLLASDKNTELFVPPREPVGLNQDNTDAPGKMLSHSKPHPRQQIYPEMSSLSSAEKRLELFQMSRAQNQANEAKALLDAKGKDQVDSSSGLDNMAHLEPKLKRQKISLLPQTSTDASSHSDSSKTGKAKSKRAPDATSFDGDLDSNMSSPTDLTALGGKKATPTAPPVVVNEAKSGNVGKEQEMVWAIDMEAVEPYKNVLEVIMDEGEGAASSRGATVCFFACHLPSRTTPKYEYLMQNIFRYFMSTLDLLMDHQCTLVYFNGAVPPANYPATSWLHQCYKMIDRRMQRNLHELLIVHPNFWFKAQLQTIGRAFLSVSFYNKIRYVDTLESLRVQLTMGEEEFRKLDIPTCIKEDEIKWSLKDKEAPPTLAGRFAMLRRCSF